MKLLDVLISLWRKPVETTDELSLGNRGERAAENYLTEAAIQNPGTRISQQVGRVRLGCPRRQDDCFRRSKDAANN